MVTIDNEIFCIISTGNNCYCLSDTLVLDNARLYIKKLRNEVKLFCENLLKST